MKPQKLVICGWGPYKNKIEVDFTKFDGRGIFLITGATGAGKTTLFDAISYALYGSLSGETRDKERSSVRSDFADAETPTYVELEMTHAGKAYRIRRNPEYMRPKKRSGGEKAYTKEKENAVLYLPEDKVIEGVKEVNAYIKDLMSLDFSQFKQLSMIAQGEFAKLLTAPPKDKTKIFREIFGTGVYERFTAILSTKAKKQYQQIMEQKHRLEEDVRMLQMSLQGFEAAEAGEHFVALTSGEHWNYEQIGLCLEALKKDAEGIRSQCDKSYKSAEKQLEKTNALYVQKTEENKRVLEYHRALETAGELEKLQDEYSNREQQYKRAVNAGWVEVFDIKYKQASAQLQAAATEEKELVQEIAEKKEKLEELLPFRQHREEIKQLIDELAEREKKAENIAILEKDLKLKEQELAESRGLYLQKEAASLSAKSEYEEALRMQRHAAIGLAAALLEEGKPCPVCGSTEHPSPAKASAEVLSEEEIEVLKQRYEGMEEEVKLCHGKVVVLQSQAKENQRVLQSEKEQELLLEQRLQSVTEPVCAAFLKRSAEIARKQWQNNCDSVQKLQTVLQEKEKRLEQIVSVRKSRQLEEKACEEEFLAALVQYGFDSEQEYRQAYLGKAERESLGKAIEQYQSRVAANKELAEHLRLAIKTDELFDLQTLEREIAEARSQREGSLKSLKKAEQFLTEVKRTGKLFAEKVAKIEEQSREYGYLKDLENMASGNNSKKLVFEQYVLAGYFEEILHAANIRFRKMTAGRYEMHRTKEVGDGRTKDNLEIEVLDYYTGKYRSVRTLSGGESFKASLSLALGLSDVIQARNGGIKVETLFIDEGFGALDSESLDQACETLMCLVESERLIGIISHVAELRERIDKQIVIDKSGSGSTLKVVV